jgi:ferredoxin-type protein NapF
MRSRRAFLFGAGNAAVDAEAPVATLSDMCLARAGIACMSCRDACPEDAIGFRPRIGGPFDPEIRVAACTGCGQCVSACPAGAISLAGIHSEGKAGHA